METLYTMAEAKAEIKKEIKERIRSYAKQKFCGLILVSIGIAAPILVEPGAVMVSFVIVPLGIYLLFTRRRVMDE